jgi:hypothetical protein
LHENCKSSQHTNTGSNEKHAECFFKQILKINFAAVKGYQESLSPDGKVQVLVKHAAEQQKYQQSLSPKDKAQMLTKKADTEKNDASTFLLRKRSKNLQLMRCCTQKATRVSLS